MGTGSGPGGHGGASALRRAQAPGDEPSAGERPARIGNDQSRWSVDLSPHLPIGPIVGTRLRPVQRGALHAPRTTRWEGPGLSRSVQTRPKLRGGDAPGPRRNLASRSHSIGPLGRVDSRRKDALARRPRGEHGGFLRERTACERRDRDKDVGVSGDPDPGMDLEGMDLEPMRDGRDTLDGRDVGVRTAAQPARGGGGMWRRAMSGRAR